MRYFFVSYAREDAPFVDDLVVYLRQFNFNFWLDRENEDKLAAAKAWQQGIVEAINQCTALLLILSEKTGSSAQVLRELKFADKKKKPLIVA